MLLPSTASSAEASSEEIAEITLRGKAIKVQGSWQGLNLWFTGKATITGAKGTKDHELKNVVVSIQDHTIFPRTPERKIPHYRELIGALQRAAMTDDEVVIRLLETKVSYTENKKIHSMSADAGFVPPTKKAGK